MLKSLPLCLAIALGAAVSANAQNPPTLGFPVGAAGIGARYHFTSDPPNVEEAKVMVGNGSGHVSLRVSAPRRLGRR